MQITKQYVDHYKPGKMIPYCPLSADFDRNACCKGEIPLLSCLVDVIGARKPRRIAIKPPPPPSPSPPPPASSELLLPYSPENKPPSLFDLQVLAQVFLPRL